METQSSLPNEGGRAPSQFSAHFYGAKKAGRIKMPLSMEVGLSPGEFVLDGDPSAIPSPKGGGRSTLPNFKGWGLISKLDRKCGTLPAVANFVAFEQQIILVKTRSEAV